MSYIKHLKAVFFASMKTWAERKVQRNCTRYMIAYCHERNNIKTTVTFYMAEVNSMITNNVLFISGAIFFCLLMP